MDLTGRTFGRLTVQEFAYSDKTGCYWWCVCKCTEGWQPDSVREMKDGRPRKAVRASKLTTGRILSCGCWKAEAMYQAAYAQKPRPRAKPAVYAEARRLYTSLRSYSAVARRMGVSRQNVHQMLTKRKRVPFAKTETVRRPRCACGMYNKGYAKRSGHQCPL
jgi:hypothetical protein